MGLYAHFCEKTGGATAPPAPCFASYASAELTKLS